MPAEHAWWTKAMEKLVVPYGLPGVTAQPGTSTLMTSFRVPTEEERAFLRIVTAGYRCDGPTLTTVIRTTSIVETILWINGDGMLDNVEFVFVGAPIDRTYERFVSAAASGKLSYNSPD